MSKLFVLAIFAILTINLASAVVINSVDVQPLSPGQEGQIRIELKNILKDDAQDVTLTLNFQNLPFIPIGTSEQSVDEIKEDDEENFVFVIKASTEIKPGDYGIPYTLAYKINSDEKTKTGAIGVKVTANPDLVFSLDTTNPVINQKGKINLEIVNKGFFSARFVSVRVIPDGFSLLSSDQDYIGDIQSDDFETATFDVLFQNTNARFIAIVQYKDFENKDVIKNVDLPLQVYSQKDAISLGIIQKSQTTTYVLIAVAIVLVIILWRAWSRRKRMKKSMHTKVGGE
jgi:hypothetical protein